MKTHFDLSDPDFEQAFASCNLKPGLFSHEAHLRLAWIHIQQYSIDTAIENLTSQIKLFAAHAGVSKKYHKTVTIAAIRAVYHFMLKSNTDNFKDFIKENGQLKHDFKALISSHYKTDIFRSEKARSCYLEPELLPFD